jgi:hypothetical protein
MFKPRHYIETWGKDIPQGKVQLDLELNHVSIRREGVPTMPESILRLAHAEYERQFPGQSYERMQQRGGLSVFEVVRLLADYVERLEEVCGWRR